jgi:two-component system response regulator
MVVLLADDDFDDLELVKEAFFKSGFQGSIATALDGQMLMDQLHHSSDRPDLILLDLNMPLKSGFEALEEIKRDPHLKSIPVMILTASSRKEDELKCFELGCISFWRKPVSMDEYNRLANGVKAFLNDSNRNSRRQ